MLSDSYISTLEVSWALCSGEQLMSLDSWCLFRNRPNNSPFRRLAAMCHLITRYRDRGLLNGLNDCFEQSELQPSQLIECLTVAKCGYWASHFDFGVSCPKTNPAVLGENRANDIAVNILLPFIFARGTYGGTGYSGETMEMYRHYPGLSDNAVLKHMRSQPGIGHRPVNSARRQQGLLHIYQILCIQGLCRQCPLDSVGQGI